MKLRFLGPYKIVDSGGGQYEVEEKNVEGSRRKPTVAEYMKPVDTLGWKSFTYFSFTNTCSNLQNTIKLAITTTKHIATIKIHHNIVVDVSGNS